MRHANHRFTLGVTKAHRFALMSNLATALFKHGRIQTTITKAKALRPFAEQIITLAKKAATTDVAADKVHYRRHALRRLRNETVIRDLFNEGVKEFANRQGGYTRIFKLGRRPGDAAEMALIEFVKADDEGLKSRGRRTAVKAVKKKVAKKAVKKETEAAVETSEAQAAEPKSE